MTEYIERESENEARGDNRDKLEIVIKHENGQNTVFEVDLAKADFYAWACVFDSFCTRQLGGCRG